MKKQTTEQIEPVEAAIETPASAPQQSRAAAALASVKSAPKWVLMAVPALVVALAGYGYLHHGDQADVVAQAPMVAGPYGQLEQPYLPVAYGPAYGNYGSSDAYGNGYGRGYSHGNGHGNGRARGSFSFSMGGDMSGDGNGWSNGGGNGWGNNSYNHGHYY